VKLKVDEEHIIEIFENAPLLQDVCLGSRSRPLSRTDPHGPHRWRAALPDGFGFLFALAANAASLARLHLVDKEQCWGIDQHSLGILLQAWPGALGPLLPHNFLV
jgi:hypothetical protein